MLEVEIDPVFAARGVGVTLGLLTATLGGGDGDELAGALREAARTAAAIASDGAAGIPAIAATRRAYKACGKDPSRYRPAAEALVRRALGAETPPAVNTAVDVCNLVSFQTGVSCGVYARTGLAPPLRLRLGTVDDTYTGIGRGPLNVAGLPVLADAVGPFGSPTSDSERTAVGAATRDILFVAYGFDHPVDDALDLAGRAYARYAGARDRAVRQVGRAA